MPFTFLSNFEYHRLNFKADPCGALTSFGVFLLMSCDKLQPQSPAIVPIIFTPSSLLCSVSFYLASMTCNFSDFYSVLFTFIVNVSCVVRFDKICLICKIWRTHKKAQPFRSSSNNVIHYVCILHKWKQIVSSHTFFSSFFPHLLLFLSRRICL